MSSRTLAHLLAPFAPFRTDPRVTDIVVNRPGEVGVEKAGEWHWFTEPSLTYERLDAIGILCAFQTDQDVDARRPLCDTILPGGERLKICRPPAVPQGTISLSIRVPSMTRPTLEYLATTGLFEHYPSLPATIRQAVLDRKNIMICGAVGSGKTTLLKAAIEEIPPLERLVTIEDTPELNQIPHRNRLALFYSKGGQSAARTTCEQLLETSLRSRPDRVLMGELRDDAAWSYLRVLIQHPGGLVTLHAGSAKDAFSAIRMMVRLNTAGVTLSDSYIDDLLEAQIGLVIHCERRDKQWRVTDVHPEDYS